MFARPGHPLFSCLFTLAGVLPLCSLPGPAGAAPKQEKYAFLIGVNVYESIALRELPFAENDVAALAKLLGEVGYAKDNIVLMTAGSANSSKQPRFAPRAANIRKELSQFLDLARAGDSVIVALAGHGVQFKDDQEHYFCPIDADLSERKNLIPITELYRELEGCKADVKLLLVDACRNDPFTQKAPRGTTGQIASKTRPQVPDPPGGVAAFFSCSKGEEAFEDGALKHGVFFHFVLEGLRGKAANSDREITVGSLVEYVSRQVPRYAYSQLRTRQQPDLLGRINPGVSLMAIPNNITNSIGMKFARIPAGTFLMGSPDSEKGRHPDEHQHEVEITRDFYLGVHEVTQEQYRKVMGNNPSHFSPTGKGKETVFGADTHSYPVDSVSWEDAYAFCQELTKRPEERAAGRTYRLPTEAEWEYACRGGASSHQVYHHGNALTPFLANFNDHSPDGEPDRGISLPVTIPVGSYKPNAFGLYDMHGNVFEWCGDWYDENYYKSSPIKDPRGPRTGTLRVLRGGSWFNYAPYCRSACRFGIRPDDRSHSYGGFRVVCSVSREAP